MISLNLYGIGDGGGGPSKEHIELGIRQQNLEGVPKVKFSQAHEFIKKIEQLDRKTLPVWQGELYFELHRGTYTTQALMKKYNRQLELKMQFIEFLSVLTNNNTSQYLQPIWKDILLNQFHDIIPGSSIGWVYEDAHALSEGNLQKLDLVQHNLTSGLLKKSDTANNLIIFNSLSHARKEVVELECEVLSQAYSNDEEIPSQYQNGHLYFEVTLPPLGYKTVKLVKAKVGAVPLLNSNFKS